MDICEIIISFIVGMVTGWITGVLVTKYYRSKDKKMTSSEKESKAESLLMEYLEDIATEIEIIRRNPGHDYAELERLIKKKNIRYEILPIFFWRNAYGRV